MSDTPRTDAYLIESDPTRKHIVGAAFARDLKRELAAAKAEVEALRAALNTMLDYYGEDEHNKATHDAARAALAKEKS
jgi:hypothetical protein